MTIWNDVEHEEWAALSERTKGFVHRLTDDEKIRVIVAPDIRPREQVEAEGAYSAGVYFPTRKAMRIDATRLLPNELEKLDVIDPASVFSQRRFPAYMGVCVHESGHANYSPDKRITDDPFLGEWETVMEEVRCEGKMVQRFPQYDKFLRSSAYHILNIHSMADDLSEDGDEELIKRYHMGSLASLVLGRVSVGIIPEEDVLEIKSMFVEVLGEDDLKTLQAIWEEYAELYKTDLKRMLELAQEYQNIIDPEGIMPKRFKEKQEQMRERMKEWLEEQKKNQQNAPCGSQHRKEVFTPEEIENNDIPEPTPQRSGLPDLSDNTPEQGEGGTPMPLPMPSDGSGQESSDGENSDNTDTSNSGSDNANPEQGSSPDGQQNGSTTPEAPSGTSSEGEEGAEGDSASEGDTSASGSETGSSADTAAGEGNGEEDNSGTSDGASGVSDGENSGNSGGASSADSTPSDSRTNGTNEDGKTEGSTSEIKGESGEGSTTSEVGAKTRLSRTELSEIVREAIVKVAEIVEKGQEELAKPTPIFHPSPAKQNIQKADEAKHREKREQEKKKVHGLIDRDEKYKIDNSVDSTASKQARLGVTSNPFNTKIMMVQPSPNDHARARSIEQGLRKAQYREVHKTMLNSQLPPGRFNVRQAMHRTSQIAAGQEITATPWKQTRRREVDNPPITLAVATDVSGSMGTWQREVSSFTWAFSHAVKKLKGKAGAVAWNVGSTALIQPNAAINKIPVAVAGGGSTGCPSAMMALDAMLELSYGEGVRVLTVITDGFLSNRGYSNDPCPKTQGVINELHSRGVQIIWIVTRPSGWIPANTTSAVLRNPSEFGKIVGSVVIDALAKV